MAAILTDNVDYQCTNCWYTEKNFIHTFSGPVFHHPRFHAKPFSHDPDAAYLLLRSYHFGLWYGMPRIGVVVVVVVMVMVFVDKCAVECQKIFVFFG